MPLYQGGKLISGSDGKSAYQIWLEAGNTGSKEDFLKSLKGDGIEPLFVTGTNFDSESMPTKVSHSASEIIEAANKGRIIYLQYSSVGYIPLQFHSSSELINIVHFSSTLAEDGEVFTIDAQVDNDKNCIITMKPMITVQSTGAVGQILTLNENGEAVWADAPAGSVSIPSAEGVKF